MIVYGPVPSRRLGQSIGINHIPPKTCTYSCIYCQLGRTDRMQVKRCKFYQPEEIFREAKLKLDQLKREKEQVDYFSFVPDGEPTLDIHLGREIEMLKQLRTKVAVITNASLLWMDDVKEDLMKADWVSVSLDASEEETWRKIDRPHGALSYQKIIDGIMEFSKTYQGTLVTETMLVDGLNDHEAGFLKLAKQLSLIQPSKAYLLVPTRPPAEGNVKRASQESILTAVKMIKSGAGVEVECITGDEQEEGFFFTEAVAEDLLSIASVHPVREDVILNKLRIRDIDPAILNELVEQEKLLEFMYEGKKFYRKNIQKKD